MSNSCLTYLISPGFFGNYRDIVEDMAVLGGRSSPNTAYFPHTSAIPREFLPQEWK
jgi:hypothetical protein